VRGPENTATIESHIFRNDHAASGAELPRRLESGLDGISIRTHVHGTSGINIHYLGIPSDSKVSTVRFSGSSIIEHVASSELGLILKVQYSGKRYLMWLPVAPLTADLDPQARITIADKARYLWNIQDSIELVLESVPQRHGIIVPLLVSDVDVDGLFIQLTELDESERRCYFKSEWFVAENPGDIWKYLFNGSIYDPRADYDSGKRFKCQQCANAWWTYFDYIHQQTRKDIWAALRSEIALCGLEDMEESGAWRNGFWSEDMEIHSRFQLDGLHMLISEYERTGCDAYMDTARRGMEFVREELAETLDDGSIWFLHDNVHSSTRHQFRSTIFGKGEGNSLCINTHIQALTVLHRLGLNSDKEDNPYEEMIQGGLAALKRVMDHQPAESLYRYLVPRVLELNRNTARTTIGLVKQRLKTLVLRKIYWKVRARYPRFVQPNGFIDRDLTVEIASDRYHVTNLKDLLTLYLQRPLPWLVPYIKNGFEFLLGYLEDMGIEEAIRRSPYFIEVAEILSMYDKVVKPVPDKEFLGIIEGILRATGGYSLDYYTSGLVLVPES